MLAVLFLAIVFSSELNFGGARLLFLVDRYYSWALFLFVLVELGSSLAMLLEPAMKRPSAAM